MDVFPTVAAATGVAAPASLPGVSLLRADAPAQARSVYSETLFPRYHFGWSDLASLTDDRYQYIHGPRPELYDVVEDPAERRDLAAGLPPAFRALRAEMLALPRPRQAPGASDPEQLKKLAALGYIGVASPSETAENLDAPRDHLAEIAALRAGLALHGQRRYAEAAEALRALATAHPAMADAWSALAEAEHKLGRPADAIAALEQQERLVPGSPQTMLSFAYNYLDMGDIGARAALRRAGARGQRPRRGP